MSASCSQCVYSKFLTQIQRLVCRRYPPSHRVEELSRVSYHFPVVSDDDLCGEFRPKPSAAKEHHEPKT